ncbi:MAG TPA: hypothetical protein VGZ68_03705 [Acidimicrobiales bacterium]|jgi:hypothetical protein|nr:hypothetical protein [Acidimicrobiales bacterium]
MDNAEGLVTAHYVYRSEVVSSRHRRQVSLYLVARLEGSNVVARIDSLGLVSSAQRSGVVNAPGERGALTIVGRWRQTTSRHHSKVLVAPTGN